MKLFFRAFVLIAGLALSGVACAVGMEGINVSSALGEPLKAVIELAGIGEKSGDLTARLASPDVFKGAGLDYAYTLPKLKFQVETRPDGEPYLRITSQDPVNDPFVTLLVELSWSSGRLLREYTFLLDPPGYKPEQLSEPNVTPVAPIGTGAAGSVEPVTIKSASASTNVPVVSRAPSANKPVSSGRTSTGKIVIKRGDTLRMIAQQARSPDVSLERMLVALYRANADEFDGHNMNRIRVGKILRLPDNADIDKVTQTDAMEEIHAQVADWNGYRQKLAAASLTARESGSGQEISGKISTKVADQTPPAKENAKEVVRLSKGETPGDKAVSSGSLTAMQDKIKAAQEELIAKEHQLNDSDKRIAMLEKNIKDMQHLLDLKSPSIAPSGQAEIKPPTPAPNAEARTKTPAITTPGVVTAPLGASKPAPEPAANPKPATSKVEPPPPSLMNRILNKPFYLAGIAGVLAALVGGLMLMRRRKKAKVWSDVESTISEPAPLERVGESTQPHLISPASAEEEVDPISEAELFLNFGRDTQAEEILKYALQKDPANQAILLKLLSIYLDRKDAKSFYSIAQKVLESHDDEAWAKAAAMGRKLEPNNPAYAGREADEAADANLEQAVQEQVAPSLDFNLDFGDEKSGTGTRDAIELNEPVVAEVAPLDFDLGMDLDETGDETGTGGDNKDGTTTVKTPSLETAQAETQNDFIDVTSKSLSLESFDFDKPDAGGVNATAPDEIFDISSQSLPLQAFDAGKSDADAAAHAQHDGLAFLGIDLDLSQPIDVAEKDDQSAHWSDVATKIDLAKAYQEMGDATGAHEILKEVLEEGDDQQRAAAKSMLEQLPA